MLIDILYLFLGSVAFPFVAYFSLRSRKFRTGLLNKFKSIPLRPSKGRCLWVHAVSVGEARTARLLIERFRKEFPQWEIVISTGTTTGAEVAEKENPRVRVFHLPFDFAENGRKLIRRIRPDCLVLVELEIWPNLLRELRQQNVPAVVANGRIRSRSQWAYRILRLFARDVFSNNCVTVYCVQNRLYAERLRVLGIDTDRIRVTGSMKYDSIPTAVAPTRQQYFRTLFQIANDDTVLVGGSTYAEEEQALAAAYRKIREQFSDLRLIIAPRHLERIDAVVHGINSAGLTTVLRTRVGESEQIQKDSVIIVDTVGELGEIYALADVAFVGKSLFPSAMGGHNMLEPAGLGKPVLFGPYTENFAEEAELLVKSGGALVVRDQRELERELCRLIAHRKQRVAMGRKGRKAVLDRRGATDRTLGILKEVMSEKGISQ